MKTPTILIAATLLLGSAGALPLELPTCAIPALEPACIRFGGIVVGDTTVGTAHGSTEAEYNNGTYVFQGTVTADEGGRVEIILADVAFSGSGTPVHILAGGTLVIDASNLVGTPATLPSIVVEDGATVVVQASEFRSVTLEVHAATADFGDTSDYSLFRDSETALRLVDYVGAVTSGLFENNSVAIEVTRGAPSLQDISMYVNDVGIDATDASLDAERIEIFAIQDTGVRMLRGAGTMANMRFADAFGPPTTGLDIQDTSGTVVLSFSEVFQLGTGLFSCNADVSLVSNDFHDNGQDFETCPS